MAVFFRKTFFKEKNRLRVNPLKIFHSAYLAWRHAGAVYQYWQWAQCKSNVTKSFASNINTSRKHTYRRIGTPAVHFEKTHDVLCMTKTLTRYIVYKYALQMRYFFYFLIVCITAHVGVDEKARTSQTELTPTLTNTEFAKKVHHLCHQ